MSQMWTFLANEIGATDLCCPGILMMMMKMTMNIHGKELHQPSGQCVNGLLWSKSRSPWIRGSWTSL